MKTVHNLQRIIKKNPLLLLLCIVFFIFIFFRFTNLHLRIPFAWDHEQFSTQVRDIVRDHKFTLLGPRVTDDKGFFLAPYFTYLLVPFFFATNLHPNALIGFIVFVNVLFFTLTSWTLYKIFNLKYAILFLLLWAINPLLVRYDTNPWWPVLIPLGVVMLWYLLYMIYKTRRWEYWILTGAALGFFCNMHFQFVFVAGFIALFLMILYKKDIIHESKKVLLSIAAFIFMFTPLFLFDLRHNFLNIKLFSTYFSDRVIDDIPYAGEWQIVFANFIAPLTKTNNPLMTVLFLALIGSILIYLMHIKKNFAKVFYIATFCLFVLTVIGFSVYGRRPSEYYFVFLYPFIYLILVDFTLSFKTKYTIPIVILFLLFINMQQLKESIREDIGGLYYRDQAVQKILPYTQDTPVQISLDVPLGTNNGYMYLIEHHGVNISRDSRDPIVRIRIPAQKGDIMIKEMGVHIPKELKK